MAILLREIQQVRPDKWDDLEKAEARWVAFEERLGFPPKRRLRLYSGRGTINTMVIEYQWESLAEMEATNARADADPEFHELLGGLYDIIESVQVEIYTVLD